jgi:hypothetical protein
MYFNIGRILYLQVDNHLPLHRPGADDRRRQDHARPAQPDPERVRAGSHVVPVPGQFLETIVDLLSIYKRLRGFEARIRDDALPVSAPAATPATP